MPITAGDLGSAISYGYRTPQADSAGALIRGFQVGETQRLRRAQEELKKQQAQQKLDEDFQKTISAVDVKDIHPYLQKQAKEAVATKINEAQKLYRADPIKNRMTAKSLIQDATNDVYNFQEKSKAWYDLDKTPDEELTAEGRRLRNLSRQYGDARILEGQTSNLTGEGFQNGMPNLTKRKRFGIEDLRDKEFSDIKQEYVKSLKISPDTRINEFGINQQVAKDVANSMWSNPSLRAQYLDDNTDYIRDKFGKNTSKTALFKDPYVQSDLYNKFLKETQQYAGRRGKQVADAIPQGNTNVINFGNGGATVGKNHFIYDVTDIKQAGDVLKEAGIIRNEQDIDFIKGSAKFPSISPPAKASGNILDQEGNSVFLDNVKMVYIPRKKEWYAIGNKDGKKDEQTAILIDENTIAPIASIYNTGNSDNLLEIMNRRVAKWTAQKSSSPVKSSSPSGNSQSDKTLSVSTIKSKVGSKGFEGYTEKELVDYYKSQGYQIK